MEKQKRFIKLAEVIKLTGFSRGTILKLIKDGNFPASYKLSPRRKGWLNIEIDEWIDSLIEEQVDSKKNYANQQKTN